MFARVTCRFHGGISLVKMGGVCPDDAVTRPPSMIPSRPLFFNRAPGGVGETVHPGHGRTLKLRVGSRMPHSMMLKHEKEEQQSVV